MDVWKQNILKKNPIEKEDHVRAFSRKIDPS